MGLVGGRLKQAREMVLMVGVLVLSMAFGAVVTMLLTR
jgi:hypothetical protein